MATTASVKEAFVIRDKIADAISRVNRSAAFGKEKIGLEHAKVVAERLITLGYIDITAVVAAIQLDEIESQRVDDSFVDDGVSDEPQDDILPAF